MNGNSDKQPEWGYIKGASQQNGPGAPGNQWAPPQSQQGNQYNQPAPQYNNYQPNNYAGPAQQNYTQGAYYPDARSYNYQVRYRLPKGRAIAALVLGIVSLFIAAFITGTLAVILGSTAIGRCNRGEAGGKGMAIAGMVLGLIGVIGWLVMLAAFHGGADLSAP